MLLFAKKYMFGALRLQNTTTTEWDSGTVGQLEITLSFPKNGGSSSI